MYVYAYFIEPNLVFVERIRIVSEPLYQVLGGLKIVHLSDLHLSRFSPAVIKVVQVIRRIKPDVVFISGDITGSRSAAKSILDFFLLLEPRLGTYIVFGEDEPSIRDIIGKGSWRKAKVYIVQDKVLEVNFKGRENSNFILAGMTSGNEDIFSKADTFPKDMTRVLLSHKPDVVKTASLHNFRLVLAGDTHGSQTGIPFLRKIFPYISHSRYISGLYRVKDTFLFVNRGIFSEKHLRLFCPPQIAILEFRSQGRMHPKVLPQDR